MKKSILLASAFALAIGVSSVVYSGKASSAAPMQVLVPATKLPLAAGSVLQEDLAGRPFDARTDKQQVRDSAANHNLAPTLAPFVRGDGSVDVAWKDQGAQPRVFVSRFSPNGKKTLQVEVGAAEAGVYPILAGFTEDPEGNLYVLKARDEGNLRQKPEPATPKEMLRMSYDRPEVMKLWKLASNGKEVWAKFLEKDGGGAHATFSPLASFGNGKFASTSRLAFIKMRQPVYKLASDESIVVPPDVAGLGLLGYTTGDDGGKRSQLFDPKDQADAANSVLSPKVALILPEYWEKGFAAIPATSKGSKFPFFFPGGTPNAYGVIGSFNPMKYVKFMDFVNANKVKWGEKGDWQVPAAKLKLKGSAEQVGMIFAIYGSNTDYDTHIDLRHEQAYWRAVRADNGAAITGKNGAAMGHCFDIHVLPTDEGVITVERCDGGMIAANYLRQPQSRAHKAYVFEHAWSGNNCFSELGSLAAATDGYAVLITSNRSPAQPVAISGSSNEESARPRDLAIVRFKKGFSDDLDRVPNGGGQYRSFPDPTRGKLPDGIITRPATYFTNYGGEGKFDATHPRMVRTGENEYVVVWERWTRRIQPPNRLVEGSYDSTWAVKIDRDANVLKPASRIEGSPRITSGDPAFVFQGRCAWVTGDAVEKKLLLHTVDSDLNYKVVRVDL